MSKQILLPTAVLTEMRKKFKTTTVTLWSALTFKTQSPFAKMLRAAALQRGGQIFTGPVPERFVADCETIFDHENQKIIQKFGGDITVEISQTERSAAICDQHGQVIVIKDMTMDKWNRLLYGLQLIIAQLN